MQYVWAGLGLICVALAAIGVVLPLLPTVPFLLLAAFFFARSSSRLHHWLLNHPTFGPFIDEELRMIRASVLYSKGIPFLFQKRASFSVTKGLSGLGASPRNNPYSSIPGADSNFFRASFALEMSLPLSRMWVTNAGLIGQWTNDTLPASQRCGFGTNSYARAFDYSLISGDRCLGTRLELAYNIELPDMRSERLQFTQGYVGIDAGIFQNIANGATSNPQDNWSSLSLGVRSLRGSFLGEISVTRILNAPAIAMNQDENRLWIRGAVRF